MKAGRPSTSRFAALLGLALLLPASLLAQTTINVGGTTRTLVNGSYTYPTWKPLLGVAGGGQTGPDGYLSEVTEDQQTGQTDSDFVGPAGTPGFFVQFGQINGVDHLALRVIMNTAQSGNTLDIRFGFDGNRDGKIDLYLGPVISGGAATGMFFQAPGLKNGVDPALANTSPSTSNWGSSFYPNTTNRTGLPAATAANGLAINPVGFANFNITSLTTGSTAYPGWTQQGIDADSMISFAIPMVDINAALASAGVNAGFSINANTMMRWVAVTSTQDNSVNQDAYGLPKITRNNGVGDTTYASFTPLMDANGNPVPEPSTYGLALGAGLASLLGLRRRRHASALAA